MDTDNFYKALNILSRCFSQLIRRLYLFLRKRILYHHGCRVWSSIKQEVYQIFISVFTFQGKIPGWIAETI